MEYELSDWRKLGAVLRSHRLDQQLTQQTLANRAGVSRAWLARVEAGHRAAELEQILMLVGALGLTLSVKTRQPRPSMVTVLDALAEDAEHDG